MIQRHSVKATQELNESNVLKYQESVNPNEHAFSQQVKTEGRTIHKHAVIMEDLHSSIKIMPILIIMLNHSVSFNPVKMKASYSKADFFQGVLRQPVARSGISISNLLKKIWTI